MNVKQAASLLAQTVVVWNNNPDDRGTVREVSHMGVFVDWENGQRGWISFYDAKNLSICEPGQEG